MEIEVENSADQEALIHSECSDNSIHEEASTEGLSQQDSNSLHGPTILLTESIPSWKPPLVGTLLVFCTSGLVILGPPYLEEINISGDAYSAILFVSIFSCLPFVLYTQIKRSYFCQLQRLGPPSPLKIMKYGFWHGLSLLMMTYALDRKRVYCHIQEPMMGLLVMYMIVIYFIYKEMSSLKMFCLCGVLGGLFLSMDFQLNDIYKCHGKARFSPTDNGGLWNSETHTIWMIVYSGALLLFTLSWLFLERDILCRKGSKTQLRLVNTISNNAPSQAADTEALLDVNYDNANSSSEVSGGPIIPPTSGAIMNKWCYCLVWFLISSFVTVVCLLWTDFFQSIGKGHSFASFATLTSSGLGCHFRRVEETCGATAIYGWLFVLFHSGFLLSLGSLFALSGSMIFSLSVASLALPVSSFWWSLFRIGGGGSHGVFWQPQVSGELVFSLLGLPVMVLCLLYWAHLDQMKRNRTNNFLMSSTCSVDHV